MKDEIEIELSLDRIEGKNAVLTIQSDEIILPAKYLPKKTKEGDILVLRLQTEEYAKQQRQKTAKEILNEILK